MDPAGIREAMKALVSRVFALVFLVFFVVVVAFALLPIPVFYGWGEEIDHVGDLPSDIKEDIRRELGRDPAIGFAYRRFHIFWLDFWTWDGRHVLYCSEGKIYWEIGPESWIGPDSWAELLGRRESEMLSTPILYRFPLGLSIFGGLVILGTLAILSSWFTPAHRSRRPLRGAVNSFADEPDREDP